MAETAYRLVESRDLNEVLTAFCRIAQEVGEPEGCLFSAGGEAERQTAFAPDRDAER